MAANNPAQGTPTAHGLTARLQRAVRGPRPRRRSSRREVSRAHAHPTHKDAAPPQQPLSRLRSGPFSKASKCHRTYRRAGGFNSLGRSRRPGCAICVLCATTSAPRAGACHGALRGVGPSRTSAKLFNQRNGRSSTKPRAHASLPAPRVSQSWAAALLGGCLGRGGVRGAAGRRRRRRCGRQVHAQPQDQSTLRTACQTQTSAVVVWGQVDGGGRGIEL